jgi:hypothetical protein
MKGALCLLNPVVPDASYLRGPPKVAPRMRFAVSLLAYWQDLAATKVSTTGLQNSGAPFHSVPLGLVQTCFPAFTHILLPRQFRCVPFRSVSSACFAGGFAGGLKAGRDASSYSSSVRLALNGFRRGDASARSSDWTAVLPHAMEAT